MSDLAECPAGKKNPAGAQASCGNGYFLPAGAGGSCYAFAAFRRRRAATAAKPAPSSKSVRRFRNRGLRNAAITRRMWMSETQMLPVDRRRRYDAGPEIIRREHASERRDAQCQLAQTLGQPREAHCGQPEPSSLERFKGRFGDHTISQEV